MKNKSSMFLLVTPMLIVSSAIAFGFSPDKELNGVTSADWLSLLVTFISISISIYCFTRAKNHAAK
jgi:hypothetical protein